jgi:hypothetical protein
VLVDALLIEGADVTLVRTAEGVALPIAPPAREPEAREPGGAKEDEGGGLAIAVREVRVEKARVTLIDRTVKPAQEWRLTDLDAVAQGRLAAAAPIAFRADGRLGGAKLHLAGEASREGPVDVKLALARFDLAPLAPYLPPPLRLAGAADLEVEARGADLAHVSGPLALELTDAEITHGESFRKPAGERAALVGRLVREGETFRLEDGQLALRDASFALRAESIPRGGAAERETRVRLDAPRFELGDFAGWLPGLAAAGVSGGAAVDGLEARLAPLAVRGGVVLDGVSAPVGATRGRLSGRLEGQGDALVGEALELRLAEQLFRLGVRVESLAVSPMASLRLASEGADAGALVGGLSGKPSTLEGPLALSTDLRAPLGDPDALLRALTGELTLGVTPGRLRGVSPLRAAFLALGDAGGLAERLGAKNEKLERFYRDAFETLDGSFQIAGGRARTDDLRLVYEEYQVDLAGVLGLLDRSLDFRGKLTLFEELDRALGDGTRGVRRVLPLAAVTGTLDDPQVAISPRVAVAFAAAVYGGGERREKLERKIEEKLGAGSAKPVFDLLDSVLGGGAPREKEKP